MFWLLAEESEPNKTSHVVEIKGNDKISKEKKRERVATNNSQLLLGTLLN
jgi:hypothetical protein